MLAVLFSLLLTLYLIIPEAIFRMIFGWYVPPRNFVISTAESAYRALVVAILPFAFAWAFSWYMPIVRSFPFPVRNATTQSRRSDYKLVTSALCSEDKYKSSKRESWPAFRRCARRQARLPNKLVHASNWSRSLACWMARRKLWWNGAKSTASFAKDMFPNQPTHYCASPLLMRTISNDQTAIERGCACSSERVLRQGFSG